MSAFKVQGSAKLSGEIVPQGAKNEALQVVSAVLLTDQKVRIENLPNILDVNKLIDLLRDLGVEVQENGNAACTFCAKEINLDYLSSIDFVKKAAALRGSVMLVGPLLARFGVAYMPRPGGDKIGRRRLDTHLIGLEMLGGHLAHELLHTHYVDRSRENE
jgi:UDP-N-acetylglucosamine 1-carboxyvinyltransferase